MKREMAILGFAGSLRKDSYNKALLRAAVELAPKKVKFEVFDFEGIPPFNQDLENRMPNRVKEFKAKIKAADAILIVTPEYDYSVPGVLKNAIDWASRPYGDNALKTNLLASLVLLLECLEVPERSIIFVKPSFSLTRIRSIGLKSSCHLHMRRLMKKGK
jgi:hypothetical protein